MKTGKKSVPPGDSRKVAGQNIIVPDAGSRQLTQSEKAKLLVDEFKQVGIKISLRTAYRHLAKGTLPSKERRQGSDGKTYPAQNSNAKTQKSEVQSDLALCRQALKRADRKAVQYGLEPAEVRELGEILRAILEISERWNKI